jgi:hypothetical protein
MIRSLQVRLLAAAGCLALLLAPTGRAHAEEGDDGKVQIGSVSCFTIRRPDGRLIIRQRVFRVHNVFAKHLGGNKAAFTTQVTPTRVQIFLNGDFVIAVTAEDAKATGYKRPADLAAIWVKSLKHAFEETYAQHDGRPS